MKIKDMKPEYVEKREKRVRDLQKALWAWSKESGVVLSGEKLALFVAGWKARDEQGEIKGDLE